MQNNIKQKVNRNAETDQTNQESRYEKADQKRIERIENRLSEIYNSSSQKALSEYELQLVLASNKPSQNKDFLLSAVSLTIPSIVLILTNYEKLGICLSLIPIGLLAMTYVYVALQIRQYDDSDVLTEIVRMRHAAEEMKPTKTIVSKTPDQPTCSKAAVNQAIDPK